jgi:hypothetical protein
MVVLGIVILGMVVLGTVGVPKKVIKKRAWVLARA